MAHSNPTCKIPSCGDWCLSHGHSLTSCYLPPVATHYTFGPLGTTSPGECYPSVPLVPLNTETCKWEEGGVVFDVEDGLLVYSLGENLEYTITWITPPEFNPLCPFLLVYDKEHPLNNPPPGCDVAELLCAQPSSVCCDNINLRPESMPNTLYGTLDYCCGYDQHLDYSFELNWNATSGRWESVGLHLCGSSIYVSVRCNCGTLSGCGGGSFPCYPVTFKVDEFDVAVEQEIECSCYPFQTLYFISWYPCSAEYLQNVTLTITE